MVKIYNPEFSNLALFNRLRYYEGYEDDDIVGVSKLGTPIYDNLIIEDGSYISNNNQTVEYEGVILNTVLISVSQTKNVVKTAINGRNGTIKEFVSSGDYNISVGGLFTSDSPIIYPEKEVLILNNIFSVPDSLKVTSKYLNRLGIYEIVIEDFSLRQKTGYYNVQEFTFRAISEVPLEIRKEDY